MGTARCQRMGNVIAASVLGATHSLATRSGNQKRVKRKRKEMTFSFEKTGRCGGVEED